MAAPARVRLAHRIQHRARDGPAGVGLERPETRLPLVELGRLVDTSHLRELPVEALDLGAGYELAAATIRGLTRRLATGKRSVMHMSLARTAAILTDKGEVPAKEPVIRLLDRPWGDPVYASGRGPVRRLRFQLAIERNPLFWEHPADIPGASTPIWVTLPARSVSEERRAENGTSTPVW